MRKGLEEDLGPEAATPGTRGTVRRGEATQLPWDLEAGQEVGIAGPCRQYTLKNVVCGKKTFLEQVMSRWRAGVLNAVSSSSRG